MSASPIATAAAARATGSGASRSSTTTRANVAVHLDGRACSAEVPWQADRRMQTGTTTADDTSPAPPHRSRWRRILSIAVVVVVVLAVAAFFVRLPYVIISPGDATPVNDVVRINGAKTYRSPGAVLFLTVSVTNQRPNLYRMLAGWLSPDSDIISEKDDLGCLTRHEDDVQNEMYMTESQQTAKAVALGRLGYHVTSTSHGVVVFDVGCKTPALGHLQVGDEILAVDGKPVTTSAQVGPLVRAHQPGQSVAFTVRRGTQRRDVSVKTERAPSGPYKGQAQVGIVATDDLTYTFPVDVRIDPGPVTGPSAGLAFTLTVLDELTPGSLTAGHDVAVTGTIESDGSVGPVGGVAQKAVTARGAGARLFLVPTTELADARKHAGSMKVVGVRNLSDALRALQAAGGAPLPPAPSTTTATAGVAG